MGGLITGAGALGQIADLVPAGAEVAALLHTPPVSRWARMCADALAAAGLRVAPHVMADAEAGKSLAEVDRAWSALAAAQVKRSDVVVAVGGGALTDAAGFVAATWLRGVAWVAVPTTTLGMTDAAHGGKVAVNTADGKNLVGAFHEPGGVLVDPAVLSTLGERDVRAGLVEALKTAWLTGAPVEDPLGAGRDALIALAARVKREIVARDPQEHGDRVLLNYGHTVGHAVEAASGYGLRHGEAVAVGMVVAAEIAERIGRGEKGLADRHRARLEELGVGWRWSGDPQALTRYLRLDKKRGPGGLRWVLLEREGTPFVTSGVPDTVLRAALAAVA